MSKKNWIDYADEILWFWEKNWKLVQKTKIEFSRQRESHWDSQNQMRLENYIQCQSQCATQWDSQNHMKRANVCMEQLTAQKKDTSILGIVVNQTSISAEQWSISQTRYNSLFLYFRSYTNVIFQNCWTFKFCTLISLI